jgi:hypothetical protein
LAAQQVAAGLQQLTVLVWQAGAAGAVQAGFSALQQVTFAGLLHLTFAGLQQSLASAAPLNAAKTARVALNATNFSERFMLSPFHSTMMAGPLGLHRGEQQHRHGPTVQDDSRPTLPGR